LQKYGLNIVAAAEQGKYIALDAAGALSTVKSMASLMQFGFLQCSMI
jgi:hypothetical protein